MKEFEVQFFKNGEEIYYFIINADNIEGAKAMAEYTAHKDGVWSYDLKIKVAEDF